MNKAPKAGMMITLVIMLFVVSVLGALINTSPGWAFSFIWKESYYLHVTKFSFYQALLSTLLSVGLAIPVAHALSRRDFRAKSILLKLFSSTLVLPVLVGVFGLLAIYGNSGVLARFCQAFDGSLPFSIYGLNGILLAHVFFNLPYAARLLLYSLESIPVEQHQLSAHLGMSHWNKFRYIEWPRLRQQLPHVCGLVFMLCFTSFATVMALGGGPKATTIELAIYQAIKFDFDLQAGAILAIWQMLLCGLLSLLIMRFSKPVKLDFIPIEKVFPVFQDNVKAKSWDLFWIFIAVLLVVPPLIVVAVSGFNTQLITVFSDSIFWHSLISSLTIACLSAVLALGTGFTILVSSRFWRLQGRRKWADSIELTGSIILVTPGLVISVGLFLLIRKYANAFDYAFIIVVLVNAMMALPYIIKSLSQPMLQIEKQYQMIMASLGMQGISRYRLVEWQALRGPIINAFVISFMLSMGDLSAIALFGNQNFSTLPLYLYQLLGSYQMEAAAVVSLSLLVLSLGSFALLLPEKTHLED